MNKRNKLFKKYCCSLDESIHKEYKRVRNQVAKLFRIPKQESIQPKVEYYGPNYIHTVFSRQCSKAKTSSNCEYSADKLNDFFVIIGPSLDQKVEPPAPRFWPERLKQFIYFSDTNIES